ncbi:TPA: hypothetical protein ENS27_05605, partial [bacterium]|nr:hypothetical protein [bacterium]
MKSYANIVFPIPIDSKFSYAIPEELLDKAKIGVRALAPFGKSDKETEGVIVELTDNPEIEKVKEIIDVLDNEPFYADDILGLTKWIAEYYFSSWGEALKTATPAGINIISKRIVDIKEIPNRDEVLAELSKKAPLQSQILTTLAWEGKMTINKLKTRLNNQGLYSALASLESKGYITVSTKISAPLVKPVTAHIVHLVKPIQEIISNIEDIRRKSPKQAQALEMLITREGQSTLLSELVKLTDSSPATIKALEKREFVKFEEIEIFRDPLEGELFIESKNLQLNNEQLQALND